jgi:hypothetical protein
MTLLARESGTHAVSRSRSFSVMLGSVLVVDGATRGDACVDAAEGGARRVCECLTRSYGISAIRRVNWGLAMPFVRP